MASLVTGRMVEGATATSVTLRLDLLARVWIMLAVTKSKSPITPITSLHVQSLILLYLHCNAVDINSNYLTS